MLSRSIRSNARASSTEENTSSNEEALLRRIRSKIEINKGRRYHYFDELAESADELINPLPVTFINY
jgi:hypothetical protein